jgi:hypothetical protein
MGCAGSKQGDANAKSGQKAKANTAAKEAVKLEGEQEPHPFCMRAQAFAQWSLLQALQCHAGLLCGFARVCVEP